MALALPAGEPVVDRTVQQGALHTHQAAFGVDEGEEHPRRGALLGHHGEQVNAVVEDSPCGHLVGIPAGEDVRQGALARPVRAHHRVDLAVWDHQADPVEDLAGADRHVQVLDAQHQRRLLPGSPTATAGLRQRTPSGAPGTPPGRSRSRSWRSPPPRRCHAGVRRRAGRRRPWRSSPRARPRPWGASPRYRGRCVPRSRLR